MVKLTFEEGVKNVRDQMRVVGDACSDISSSSRLKKILEIVLAVGNYLNGGTNRGRVILGIWSLLVVLHNLRRFASIYEYD